LKRTKRDLELEKDVYGHARTQASKCIRQSSKFIEVLTMDTSTGMDPLGEGRVYIWLDAA
jgi:hypothetical protein